MIRIFVLLVVVTFFASCGSVKKYNQQISGEHTVQELHQDVDLAYSQLKKYHPKLYQYTSQPVLDFKFDSLKQSIRTPLTSRQFYEKLAQVVTNVHQGHISVSPPHKKQSRKERREYRDKKFAFNTMDFEYLDKKLWVIDAQAKDTILIGTEVVSVAGETPQRLIEKYNSLIASDGFNQTLFDGMVGSRFPKYYYKNNGFVDSLQLTFRHSDSLFKRTFRWKEPNEKKIDSIAETKKEQLTRAERKAAKIVRKKKKEYNDIHGYVRIRNEYTRKFKFLDADSTIAYMKIRGFSNGSYEEFYEQSFATLDSLGTQHLIIDLRDNGGGRLSEIEELYSYLTEDSYKFINKSEVTRRLPFLDFMMSDTNPWFFKVLGILGSPAIVVHNLIKTEKNNGTIYYKWKYANIREPKNNPYTGELFVLINGNSFSASSILSTHLKATGRATFVGQETGGAYNGTVAGLFRGYELPNSKVTLRMGLMQIEAPYATEPDGYGVKPDVTIKPTRADREQHRDPEIEYIVDLIESKD